MTKGKHVDFDHMWHIENNEQLNFRNINKILDTTQIRVYRGKKK